jgi:hypothetical protein
MHIASKQSTNIKVTFFICYYIGNVMCIVIIIIIEALSAFQTLENQYHNNLYVMQNVAKCEIQCGESERASNTFERVSH